MFLGVMKIYTFPNCAYLSETSRMIAIYKELETRGFDVIMATHGGPYEWLFEEAGIQYRLIDPHFTAERARDFVATNTGEKGLSEFYSEDELSEHVQNEIRFFKKENITKVLTGFTLSCAISARVLDIHYAVTHLGSFVPPVFERKSEVLEKVYEAVQGLDAKVIICSTLHHFRGKPNPNLLVAGHLPSHKVMPMMDMAIIHGGQGSVQTAINAGIPIIGIPLHVEQGLNIAIIERHGAGLLHPKRRIDPLDIRDKILTILNDESYGESMKQLSVYQKEVDGVSRAADILCGD